MKPGQGTEVPSKPLFVEFTCSVGGLQTSHRVRVEGINALSTGGFPHHIWYSVVVDGHSIAIDRDAWVLLQGYTKCR